jgi:hypothetical protein
MQHLLARAEWDADLVREDLLVYVVDHPASRGRSWWWTRPGT